MLPFNVMHGSLEDSSRIAAAIQEEHETSRRIKLTYQKKC
jgi:hypothetical protein